MLVKEYKSKKLVEYLRDGMKVCIVFVHGLGDTFMFYPVFMKLQKLFPNVQFTFYTENGQDEWFGSTSRNEADYDIVFEIAFYCCEGIRPYVTKAEYCCKSEIGITFTPDMELSYTPQTVASPLVAVHFNSTCRPAQVGCNERVAKLVWNGINQAGYIPIETHFIHNYSNSKNAKFNFVTNNVRDCKCRMESLIGLIQHCRGFVGVASGPFCIAMSLFPKKVLLLKNSHDIKCFYKWQDSALSMDINRGYDDGVFAHWLDRIK